ncbi:hypothetical protein GV828_02585 [Flavobacterium sp. NST-5]|uniref:Aminopeptidase n=1 Tax=Flavobacterium ichthyis TaxID=2698827 RepID=A0ABW9Z8B6_9FLAO|nr:hypothetical protein [Flavobacterium ichthyis]NBL64084.1 hypothetical protein [Flavobacterium ichthyis]
MEPVKIFFFALASFFGVENQRILADKTLVTVYPQKNQIEIIQENIFAIVPTSQDLEPAKAEWDNLYHYKQNGEKWSDDLAYFSDKKIEFSENKKGITAKITLTYTHPNDMAAMGIWYNEDENQFAMNYIPEHNLKTKDGKKNDIFWNFDGKKDFSFTLEPFRAIPRNKKFTDF